MVKAKFLGPDSNHAPAIQYNDGKSDDVEHCFSGNVEFALGVPERIYADGLRSDADNEKISRFK